MKGKGFLSSVVVMVLLSSLAVGLILGGSSAQEAVPQPAPLGSGSACRS